MGCNSYFFVCPLILMSKFCRGIHLDFNFVPYSSMKLSCIIITFWVSIYCANDRIITRIETQELPSQPYINIYKEAHSVSQSTVEPLDVQDIDLQENINKEKNESYNRNVISYCDDCDNEVTHICKED